MQTFLPYSDFKISAVCLDNRRLGKQRVECLQILKSLTDVHYGWRNHPAVKMWEDYEAALYRYACAIIHQWTSWPIYGIDNCLEQITYIMIKNQIPFEGKDPFWLGDEKFHLSHRSKLLQKDYDFYRRFGWNVSNNLDYIWPVA